MKSVVIYDSLYGNTGTIATAIAAALGASAIRVTDANAASLAGADLVLVGSPTQGGRPTPATMAFLRSLPSNVLAGKYVASFDTRIAAEKQALPLRLLIRLIGYAAPRIASALEAHGGLLQSSPRGFIVDGKEGPLTAGELDRAVSWAQDLRHPALRVGQLH